MTLAASTMTTERAGRLSAAALAPPLAALCVAAIAAFSPTTLNDGDSFWHVSAGNWILAHRAVPAVDIFSFSMAGQPWTAHEWLSEVLMALAYRVAGWAGVLALTGAAAGTAAFLITRRLARFLDGPALVIVTLLALGLIGPGLLARPHVLALPLLVAWALGLMAARDARRAPSLALLPLMTLWANLHGGFALGLALTAVFALEALIEAEKSERVAVVRGWGLFGAAAGCAALLTPNGFEGFIFPLKLLEMKSLALVGEWKPSDFSKLGPLEIALLALLGLALTQPLRLAPVRLALLLGLVHLALSHARHKMVLGALAPLLLAEPIARALSPAATLPRRPLPRGAMAVSVAALLMLAGLRLAVAATRGDGPVSPVSALAAVPTALRSEPVLNAYDFGGYLIFSGVKPFIDGRTDLYGDVAMAEYNAIKAARPGAFEAASGRYAFAWTLLHPGDPLVAVLDHDPSWRRRYADDFAVVHVRQ